MVSIQEINQEEKFSRLEGEWEKLLTQVPNSHIFQEWVWQYTWWRIWGKDKKLLILTAFDEGQILGIAPLCISHYLKTSIKQVQFIGSGVSDYLDFIILPNKEEEIIALFLEYLLRRVNFDLINLQQIPETSNTSSLLTNLSQKNNLTLNLQSQDYTPFIKLPPTFSEYERMLNKRMRSNLRYYLKIFLRDFPESQFKKVENQEELKEVMKKFFYLHQKRWRKKGLPGMIFSQKRKNFHLQVAQNLFNKDLLSLYFISTNKEVVSVIYGFNYKKRFYYYLSGFDPNLAKYSLGNLLIAHCINEGIKNNLQEFDFLRGNEDYKFKFGAQSRKNLRVIILKPNPKAKLAFYLNHLGERLANKVKEISHKKRQKAYKMRSQRRKE